MHELNVVQLGSLGADRPAAFATGPFGSAVSAKNFQDAGVPMIRGGNLSENVGVRLDNSDLVFVSEELASRFGRSIATSGDLIFTCWGTVGQLGFIEDGSPFDKYLVSNKQMKMTPDGSRVVPLYLYYYLSQPAMRSLVKGRSIGSSVPGFNLGQLRELPVALPNLGVQRAIVEVLGALDDKMAANEKLGDALDRLEEGMFTRLAVKSKCRSPLSKIARVIKGVSYRSDDLAASTRALITLKSIGRDGRFAYRGFKQYVGNPRPDQIVSPGDITVAQTDLTQGAEVIGWAVRVPRVREYQQLAASLDLVIVRSTSVVPNEYLLGALRQRGFRSHCHARMSGTTVLHLAAGAIESYEVPILDDMEMHAYAKGAASRLVMADEIAEQSRNLAATRDELLPLLMSGKIRVREAEKVVEGIV